jgi:hypothetical protein
VVIHNLYMDDDWDAHNPHSLDRATLDDFTRKLLASGYFSKAAQYGVVDAVFTGSDQGSAACPAPGPAITYITLSSWILCEKHHLPAYSAHGGGVNLWQVYVPAHTSMEVAFSWPWGHAQQRAQRCLMRGSPWWGFHAITQSSVVPPEAPQVFGVVALGCTGADRLNVTWMASHQLIDAATDPDGLAWGNGALGGEEAADRCENVTGSLDRQRYFFVAYWSNADGGCVAPGDGATFTTLDS